MVAADIIRIKRDGGEMSTTDIQAFVQGVADQSVSEVQLGAFLMSVYLKGMTAEEQASLTLAMRDSGRVLEWPGLDGPVLDKHSTGGVGDLVSLILAPLVAACGAYVPMISGRGLGHTGGTLDKLESVPGLNINPDLDVMDRIVRAAGFAMVGQGPDLAPADRRMYAARDVTATVSSVPLIVSSILAKKLAAGLDGLVLDVKTGNGAFMPEFERSALLAQTLEEVSAAAGTPCRALVTNMNQPLAWTAGNALEMDEAIQFLTGGPRNPRIARVVFALAVEMLRLGGLEADEAAATTRLEQALDEGHAAERFARMVAMQGGPKDLLDRPGRYLARAPVIRPLDSGSGGYVAEMQTRVLGECVRELGGGRHRVEDTIDVRVGLSGLCSVGDRLERGAPLATIHADSEADWQRAAAQLGQAIRLSDGAVEPLPVVYQDWRSSD